MSPEQNLYRPKRAGSVVCPAFNAATLISLVTPIIAAGMMLTAIAVTSADAAGACANEAVRAEQGAAALALPECRGYELVTPPNDRVNLVNNTSPIVNRGPGGVEAEASAAGGAVAFRSWYSPSGSPSSGHMFRSVRGGDGWSTVALEPALGPQKANCTVGPMYFSAYLSGEVLGDYPNSCSAFEPPLAMGESRVSENLFVHVGEVSSYYLLNRLPEGVTAPPEGAHFQAASADMGRIIFSEEAQLVPAAPAGDDLYEWAEGVLRLVTYLPDGAPIQGTMAAGTYSEFGGFGQSPGTIAHSVSADGERVVFDAGGALYLRENAARGQSAIVPGSVEVDGEQCSEPGKACTVQLDASHGSGTGGGGVFWRASADGSRIFFTDESRLTPEATATAGNPDLYEYSVATGGLTDLTVDSHKPADVLGVAGASEDGTYLYFVAEGVLSELANDSGASAVMGKPNLYLLHDGVTSYIATLSRYDRADWGVSDGISSATEQEIQNLSSEVSPSGLWLAFNSVERLTGYENMPAEPEDCEGSTAHQALGEPCDEIFVYDAAANSLSCVSCAPESASPTGEAELRATLGTFARRALSVDGNVFFDTPSPLLGQDTNGTYDVYEWSPAGVGACGEGSATFGVESDGCLYSISSGVSPEPSYFVDASESGEDAYFVTSQGLVQADTDNALSLYDARVDGGFPAESGEAAGEAACVSAEACEPPASEAPAQLLAASSVLSVGGNLVAPPVPVTPSVPGEASGGPKVGLTRAQKLAKALRACQQRPRRLRTACRAAARHKFGTRAQRRVVAGGKGSGR